MRLRPALLRTKSYVYAGSRLLSTYTGNGTGGETLEFHHPDRLGTKVVTNNAADTLFEQSTLPFGTAMPGESSGFSNRLFTTYDRSPSTALDYAVNRTYSPGQGRFTTPDPIGMASVSPTDPQTLNQFAYTRNTPTDFTDPSGLLLGSPTCHLFVAVVFSGGGEFAADWRQACETNTDGGVAGYGIGHRVTPQDDGEKDICDEPLLKPFLLGDSADLPGSKDERNLNFIHKDAAAAFDAALQEINMTNGPIGFTDVFRDSEMQQRRRDLYLKGLGPPANKKETSMHESGFAFDVIRDEVNKIVIDIFKKYGFNRTALNSVGEKWHFAWKGAKRSEIPKVQEYYKYCILGLPRAGGGKAK